MIAMVCRRVLAGLAGCASQAPAPVSERTAAARVESLQAPPQLAPSPASCMS